MNSTTRTLAALLTASCLSLAWTAAAYAEEPKTLEEAQIQLKQVNRRTTELQARLARAEYTVRIVEERDSLAHARYAAALECFKRGLQRCHEIGFKDNSLQLGSAVSVYEGTRATPEAQISTERIVEEWDSLGHARSAASLECAQRGLQECHEVGRGDDSLMMGPAFSAFEGSRQ